MKVSGDVNRGEISVIIITVNIIIITTIIVTAALIRANIDFVPIIYHIGM